MIENLLLQGNVGLIFTKGDLKEVSEEVGKYKVNFNYFHSSFNIWYNYGIYDLISI